MKLRIAWIGKTKSRELSALIEDFLKRLQRLAPAEILELRDPKTGDDRRQLLAEEKLLLGSLDKDDRVVILDVAGQPWTSGQLAQFVGKHLAGDPRRLTFVIGGYGGITEKVKAAAEKTWALSPLTLTHEMTRLIVVEQLYRAVCILNHHPYSK
jgi:23S rRNA (pseudouridine1915-N3)-methyltransferase